MDEVSRNQEVLINSVLFENEHHERCNRMLAIDETIDRAKTYHQKLVNIKRNMLLIKDRTARLKRQANKLLEDRQREKQEIQRNRQKREILERHLEPVVNTGSDD